MTEAEWLALKDVPEAYHPAFNLFSLSRRTASLFMVACVRVTPGTDGQRRLLSAVKEVEQAADAGQWDEVARLQRAAWAACQKVKKGSAAHAWAYATSWLTYENLTSCWTYVPQNLRQAVRKSGLKVRGLRGRYVALLHDIAGNPFRPVTFDPAWASGAVVGLATTMYESRDFAVMPILADALEDAGCENREVLDHCRGPGPHVRGCWAIDLILGLR